MKYKFEKNIRIVNDLIMYCHRMGSGEYHVDMKLSKDLSIFMISAPVPKMDQDDLEILIEMLNTPRQMEVEQSYWALSGESDTSDELALVGMMTDDVSANLTDGVLTIVVSRMEG